MASAYELWYFKTGLQKLICQTLASYYKAQAYNRKKKDKHAYIMTNRNAFQSKWKYGPQKFLKNSRIHKLGQSRPSRHHFTKKL
jgi:hypothetical protein